MCLSYLPFFFLLVVMRRTALRDTYLSGKSRQNLEATTSNLGPLAFNVAELVPVGDPVQWQDVKLLVLRYVTHCSVILLG